MLFRSITIFSNNIATIIIITNKPIDIVFIQTSRIILFLCSFISSKEYSIPVLALDTESSNIIFPMNTRTVIALTIICQLSFNNLNIFSVFIIKFYFSLPVLFILQTLYRIIKTLLNLIVLVYNLY